MTKKKNITQRICIILFLAIFVFITIFGIFLVSEKQYEEKRIKTQEIGNHIISLIDGFKVSHGRYPKNLLELGEVEKPVWGEKWIYEYNEREDSYSLLVGSKLSNDIHKPVMIWDSKNQVWIYDE